MRPLRAVTLFAMALSSGPAHAAETVILAAETRYFPPPTQARSFADCRISVRDVPTDISPAEAAKRMDDAKITGAAFENYRFSEQLRAAREPSLYQQAVAPTAKDPDGSYRFTLLRSFENPITVRVDDRGGKMLLTAKRLTGHGGSYIPGRIAETLRRELTPAEGAKVRIMLNPATTMHYQCGICCDGSDWIVETRNGKSYHYGMQWSPEAGQVRAFGLYMLVLTGWKTGPIY